MAKDIIKSFDEEIEKNEELLKSAKEAEVAKSEDTEDTEKAVEDTDTENSEKAVEDTEKSEKGTEDEAEKSDKEEAEKSEDEAEKSEDEAEKSDKEDDEEAEKSVAKSDKEDAKEDEAEKSDEEDKEDKEEKAEKSADFDVEGLLNVVLKSYSQLSAQVATLTTELTTIKGSQETISKSLDSMKVTPIQEATMKSVDAVEAEPEGKAVGYMEKSSTIDDDFEDLEKSAHNVDSAPVTAPTMGEVETMFKSKFEEASKSVASARDENALREITKSWQRYINDRATSTDTERLNNFLNGK